MLNKDTKKQAARILRKASQVIDNGHFVKGQLHDGHGRHCALGGIEIAAKGEGIKNRDILNNARRIAKRTLLKFMRKASPGVWSIPAYNDDYGTTAKDVIRLMQAAAQQLAKDIKPTIKKTAGNAARSASQYFFKNRKLIAHAKTASEG